MWVALRVRKRTRIARRSHGFCSKLHYASTAIIVRFRPVSFSQRPPLEPCSRMYSTLPSLIGPRRPAESLPIGCWPPGGGESPARCTSSCRDRPVVPSLHIFPAPVRSTARKLAQFPLKRMTPGRTDCNQMLATLIVQIRSDFWGQ